MATSSRGFLSFCLIYVSYVAFYFNRKNYAFWLNELVGTVGMSMERASMFGSALELSYGVGKLLAGPLVDSSSSPSFVLTASLAFSSVCNLALFSSGIYYADLALWSTSGFVQSVAWPALAIIFLNWYKDSPKRGTMYSILSTSQNVGTGSIPIILTPIVSIYGWRASTIFPGVFGLCMATVLLLLLKDGPEETEKRKLKEKKSSTASSDWTSSFVRLFSSANFLLLGLGYTFLTVVRVGFADWSLLMLQEVRGLPKQDAKNCLVALELGGFIGGLLVGSISDVVFSGRRTPAMYWSCALLGCCVAAIFWMPLPKSDGGLTLSVIYGLMGFSGFGPHMLVGLLARELYPELPSTAGSYSKFIGQVGGSLAGYPISLVASSYGWQTVGYVWFASALSSAAAFSLVGDRKGKQD